MSLQQTITCEGPSDTGIPIGEIEQFVSTVIAAGSGVHQPVTVTKTGGTTRLSVDLITGADETPVVDVPVDPAP